jgi:DNA-binding winged helix-turn-helix (wHTH) protein
LFPAQRLLRYADKPVPLGSRALDILIALVERSGELLGKDELMARIWPKIFVHPGNLTVHIAALRRALGDGRDGNRFIVNVPGRGYQFVAAIRTPADPQSPVKCAAQGNASAGSLSI